MTQLISTAPDDALVLARCPNCGAETAGAYCGACGQKRIHESDFTVRHFVGHVLHEFTHFESNKFLATLVALVCHPGLLTVEYLAGRKGRHIEPIRLYLTISAVFFLFAWGAHLERGGFTERVPKVLAPVAEKAGVDTHTLFEEFSHKFEKYAAVTRFVSVLGSGFGLALLFRSTKQLYLHHLIFALHYVSFYFLLSGFYTLVFAVLKYLHVPSTGLNRTSYLVLFGYAFLAMRTVHQQSRPATAWKAAAFVAIDLALYLAAVVLAGVVAAAQVMLPLTAKP